MTKNTYVGLGVGVLISAVIVGGSFWYVYNRGNQNAAKPATKKTASNTGSVRTGSGNGPVLGQSTNGLSVNQDTQAASLGQITDAKNQQAGSTNGSTTKQTNPFDPATFAQYEKYKNDNAGLFAEAQIGTGKEVTMNKKAAVFYRGWLTNGQLFDESRKDESGQLQPFIFTQGAHEVILGWEQALSGMKVGGVRLVIVPPAVGYGAQGQGPIPPNAVLIFQIQLLEVE